MVQKSSLGMMSTTLSGNALNLNWIVTHFLHIWGPNQFGGLQPRQVSASYDLVHFTIS